MGTLEEVTVARIAEVEDCSKQWCLAWHHSGGILASCGDDKVVRVWKCTSEPPFLECRTKLDSSHSRAIRSVCFSHDGKFLASASFDSTIVIYEKGEDGEFEETNKLEGHESEVKGCAFSSSDEFFATCSRDKSVWFWQLDEEDDFAVSSILQPHTGDVKFVAWHPTEDLLISCSYDFSIRFYKFDGEDWVTHQHIDDAHDGTVWSAAFDGSGRRLVTVGEDRVLQLWTCTATPEEGGVRNGKWQKAARYTVEGTRWPLYSVSWNNVSELIAVGGGDETVRVLRVQGMEGEETIDEMAVYSGHEGDVNCVLWHPKDPTLLASASDDGSIRLLRIQL
ncbi:hypothetical protein PENTCL1PPCAC_23043 [Pristionchus entomophagus]|uniref:Probable cytosolic iron-sulfur protein assembly protein CIAO1 homolog n=1 Tax=Pristionchus entomophagus TaxID=358040 RepID=A0AAV5U364_9BILA|nr:hypothetical protein PENTCL1PPCAC_23043 [Pristionchus entomophagus]